MRERMTRKQAEATFGPSTTFNHRDYHLVETTCVDCRRLIVEAHPAHTVRPKRIRCFRCLASWWNDRLAVEGPEIAPRAPITKEDAREHLRR